MLAATSRRHFLILPILATLALWPVPSAAEGWFAGLTPNTSAWWDWVAGTSSPAPVAEGADAPSNWLQDAVGYVKSYGPGFPMLSPDARMPEAGMDDSVKQSAGCLISGVFGTSLALYGGAENLVNVIAGGAVASSNSIVLYTGIVGVVFASFCAIGQALTPLYLHYVDQPPQDPGPPPGSAPQQVAPPSIPPGRMYLINY